MATKLGERFICFLEFAYFPGGLALVYLMKRYVHPPVDSSFCWDSIVRFIFSFIFSIIVGFLVSCGNRKGDISSFRLRIVAIVLLGAIASIILMYDKNLLIYMIAGIGISVISSVIAFFRLTRSSKNRNDKRLFEILQLLVIGLGAFIIAFVVNSLDLKQVGLLHWSEVLNDGYTGRDYYSEAQRSLPAIVSIAAYYFMGGGLMALNVLFDNETPNN